MDMTPISARTERRNLSRFLPPAATQPRTPPTKILILATERYVDNLSIATDDKALSAISGLRVKSSTLLATQFIKEAYPRGLLWTDFPIVSDPWFVFRPVKARSYSAFDQCGYRSKTPYSVEMIDIFADHDGYAIEVRKHSSDPLGTSIELYKLAYAIKHLGNPCAPVFLKIISGIEQGRQDGEWHRVEVDDILQDHGAYAAFRYSYTLNFGAIGMKAIRAATDWDAYDKWYATMKRQNDISSRSNLQNIATAIGRTFRSGGAVVGLQHPLTTQILYALQKSGSIQCHLPKTSYQAPNLVSELFSFDATSFCLKWVGKGKHAPAALNQGEQLGHALYACGLIRMSSLGVVSISDAGKRYLELIHPDSEDPDVLVRWIDPVTGFIRPESAEAMDNWIMRHFMKMKTKVNLIPEGKDVIPELEVVEGQKIIFTDGIDHEETHWFGEPE
jgi:hypothetical protein